MFSLCEYKKSCLKNVWFVATRETMCLVGKPSLNTYVEKEDTLLVSIDII